MWALKSVQYFNQFIVPPIACLEITGGLWLDLYFFTRYLVTPFSS